MKTAVYFLFSTLLVVRLVAEETCGEVSCDGSQIDGEVYGSGRRLAGVTFGLIPAGGWSNHVTAACGLEWLWAGPVFPGNDYYDCHPGEVKTGGCSLNWQNSNRYPDCVKFSGFRLPSKAEVAGCLPLTPPPCLSTYTDDLYSHCDAFNSGQDTFAVGFPFIAVSDDTEVCWAETVYVRSIGTRDSCVDGGVSGDPHFKTWTGGRFDFHGACDLVLLENPDFKNGLGMDIHLRTKFTDQWSYVESAVVRIGTETFEVAGGQGQSRYWINKVANGDLSGGISGFLIRSEEVNSKQFEFIIELGENGETVSFKTWKDFVRVDLHNGSPENFGTSLGLMGSYSKGLKLGRDGTTIIEDSNEFGLEWQVLTTEPQLFHNIEGVQAPQKCAMPDTSKVRRRLGESTITTEEAELACDRVNPHDRDACIFDVLATNDMEVAGAY